MYTHTHSQVSGLYDFHMPRVLLFFFSPLRLKDSPHPPTHPTTKKKEAEAVSHIRGFALTAGLIFIEQQKIIPRLERVQRDRKRGQMRYSAGGSYDGKDGWRVSD